MIVVVGRGVEPVAPHGGPGGGLDQPPVPLHPHHHHHQQQQHRLVSRGHGDDMVDVIINVVLLFAERAKI